MRPQAWHIVVLVVALILLFGWKRLPDMARSIGQSMRVFKSEVDEMGKDKERRRDTDTPPSTGTTQDDQPVSGTVVDDAPASGQGTTPPDQHRP